MAMVFSNMPNGIKKSEDPIWIRQMILKRLNDADWHSTADLYAACHMKVKKQMLHEALKNLLATKSITMRVVDRVQGGSSKTEFKKRQVSA
jgi:hypothetical protein